MELETRKRKNERVGSAEMQKSATRRVKLEIKMEEVRETEKGK